jgi:hypothetical protein
LWYGVAFAVLTVAVDVAGRPNDPVPAIVGGCVGGVFFGLLMGRLTARQRRRSASPLSGMPAAQRRQVARAANRGPVPDDAEVRARAAVAADHWATQGELRRGQSAVVFGLFASGSAVFAVVSSTLWLLAVAFWLVMLVVAWRQPARLRRRAARLRAS